MTKRYKMAILVHIIEVDGNINYPKELNSGTNLKFNIVFNANGFSEMGYILEQLEAIKPVRGK